MKRRLLNLLTFLSLLLCVAAAALWAATYPHGQADGWLWASKHAIGADAQPYPLVRLRAWSLTVGAGGAEFTRVAMNTSRQTAGAFPDGFARTQWMIYGHLSPGVHRLAGGNFTVKAPAWFVIAVTAVLPVAWSVRHRRELRKRVLVRRGLCPSCGYDLRATPGRCPECGRIPPVRK